MDWSAKLSGDAYRAYWRDRMAKGAEQAGWGDYSQAQTDEQGAVIWEFIRPSLAALPVPGLVMEFGSGYGRMLRRLRGLWPESDLFGIDIAEAAVKHSWRDGRTSLLCQRFPAPVDRCPDLIFTCLALQHVTDHATWLETVFWLRVGQPPGGRLVLFENVSQPGASHVLDFTAEDYMSELPGISWEEPQILTLRGQDHALMIGIKQ